MKRTPNSSAEIGNTRLSLETCRAMRDVRRSPSFGGLREKSPSEGEIQALPKGGRAFAPEAEPARGSLKTVNEGTANCFI